MLQHNRYFFGHVLLKKKISQHLSVLLRRSVSYDQHESPAVPHHLHATPDLRLTEKIPSACHILIAGGGIIGQSIAYHLSELGVKDIVLIEKSK